ncbi:uncharacterized protein LOC114915174 [Cajanus cajan]|uniref:uncharacterized protein LOC114915174 n=1 Tax=Cajanus cajan TaxID=3821 RepID=UPI0010FB02CA|nr:uncharacterized protein LOC114915174 [Cajanus cajan]
MGWLGLLFFYPTQSLKFSTPKPFFCCVFPSYDPIVISKQTSILNESNQLAISSVSQHTKLSTGCYTKVSGDVVTPSKSKDGETKPITAKAKSNKEVFLFTQQRLLIDLEKLDPCKHESIENSLVTLQEKSTLSTEEIRR